MSIHQGRSKRKPSGGRYNGEETRHLHRLGNTSSYTEVGSRHTAKRRARGGDDKTVLLAAETANLHVPSDDEHVEATIDEVVESPANQNYVRRNIITKGCIIDTDHGRARVTSRPGQDGVINAVVIDE